MPGNADTHRLAMEGRDINGELRDMARAAHALRDHQPFGARLAWLANHVASVCAAVADRGEHLDAMLTDIAVSLDSTTRSERDFAWLIAFRCANMLITRSTPAGASPGDAIRRLFDHIHVDHAKR